ncbi:MAG: hypothetical protein V3U92_19740 [Cellulophaga sp.]
MSEAMKKMTDVFLDNNLKTLKFIFFTNKLTFFTYDTVKGMIDEAYEKGKREGARKQ